MIELRKANKNEALGDVKSSNSGKAFSKSKKIFIVLETGHKVKFSEKGNIYNIIHLVAKSHENQSDSLHELKNECWQCVTST
jgi:hypothetical protein